MKIKFLKFAIIISSLILILTGCTTGKYSKKNKSFKHDTPLIKTDVKKLGKIELEKSAKMGPSPVEGDIIKLNKRKKISSVKEKNYLLIPDDYALLKQRVSFKFQNLDYKEAMSLLAKIGEINILVGEDVAGAVKFFAAVIRPSIPICIISSISTIFLTLPW